VHLLIFNYFLRPNRLNDHPFLRKLSRLLITICCLSIIHLHCVTICLHSPFRRYNANLQQAATQNSYYYTVPGCPFEHDTCPEFCYLYGGNCDPGARFITYEPGILNYGEVVGEGSDPSDPVLFPILRVSAMRETKKAIRQ